jgi:ribosomal protein S27E
MNTISCPTCGAPVTFRSAASVMAVCDYCKSTLIKDADSVRNIGKMSEVLEDYSPIQINTSGSIDEGNGKIGFLVVGRIQLRYSAGFWNEWYVLDDRGDGAWLSDASGQYVFTRAVDRETLPMQVMPPFERIRPGGPLDLGQAPDGSRIVFIAGDVRTAQCTGGQGELPFTVGAGYTARVADFHRGDEFMTLDYSDDTGAGASPQAQAAPTQTAADALAAPARSAGFVGSSGAAAAPVRAGGAPIVYRGRSVTLEALKAQLLRDSETIKDEAGRFKGKVSNLECPSCGASIAFSPGATSHLSCPTCHATIDVTSSVAEVVAAARRMDAVHTTVALGAKATIEAVGYTVIGLMRRAEISDEASEWTEYLLYAPQKGFVWLVETTEGWERAEVLDTWPFWFAANQALYDGTSYDKLYDYNAVVRYAAGAFNWKVEVGDVNRITEFQSGPIKLAAESNESELTWSRSTPVPPQDLAMWFGKEIDAALLPQASAAPWSPSGPGGYRRIAKWLTILLLAVNAIPILFSPGRALVVTVLAVVGLYFPAWLMDMANNRKDSP